jgi:hypothetical protein
MPRKTVKDNYQIEFPQSIHNAKIVPLFTLTKPHKRAKLKT